jgi:hypothetical protein
LLLNAHQPGPKGSLLDQVTMAVSRALMNSFSFSFGCSTLLIEFLSRKRREYPLALPYS